MSKMGLYLAANTLFGSKYMVLQQGYCLAAKTLFGSKDIVWQQGYCLAARIYKLQSDRYGSCHGFCLSLSTLIVTTVLYQTMISQVPQLTEVRSSGWGTWLNCTHKKLQFDTAMICRSGHIYDQTRALDTTLLNNKWHSATSASDMSQMCQPTFGSISPIILFLIIIIIDVVISPLFDVVSVFWSFIRGRTQPRLLFSRQDKGLHPFISRL